jgi:acyl carrier protein
MSVEQKVKEYIMDNFLFTDDESSLNNSDSFMEKGIVDSTGMLEIIYYLEDEFAIKVEDDEMIPENLDSVNNIAAFLNKKKSH